MSLPGLQLPLALQIPHMDPRVRTTARHKPPLLAIDRHARRLMRRLDALEQRARRRAREKVDVLAGRHTNDAPGGTTDVELAGGGWRDDFVARDAGLGAQVPPADFLVFGGGDEDVGVARPDDTFDGAEVFAGADLVGRWG